MKLCTNTEVYSINKSLWSLFLFYCNLKKIFFWHLATNDTVYLGCYLDYAATSVLVKYNEKLDLLTTRKCIYACNDLGYLYAGLQNGWIFLLKTYKRKNLLILIFFMIFSEYCLCDTGFAVGYGAALAVDCDMQCPGNNKDTCGGQNRVSTYRIKGKNIFDVVIIKKKNK